MYFRDCFALKPFRDYSLCSVCILPQPAFYSQSAVCILHTVCILPLVRSLQSAVRGQESLKDRGQESLKDRVRLSDVLRIKSLLSVCKAEAGVTIKL